ncbi:MAG TPA: hypothetical protein VIL46_00785 [Gemmataceae bacterium]
MTPPGEPGCVAASPGASPSANRMPGEGVTVSMLGGTSTLKLFGQFSTFAVFTTP